MRLRLDARLVTFVERASELLIESLNRLILIHFSSVNRRRPRLRAARAPMAHPC